MRRIKTWCAVIGLGFAVGWSSSQSTSVLAQQGSARGKPPAASAAAEQVDPSVLTPDGLSAWSAMAPYPILIESVSLGTDGTYIWAAGGFASGTPTANAYRYDANANAWTGIASLPAAVGSARGAYAPNTNAFYVFGGYNGGTLSTNNKYSVATNSWSAAANLPGARFFPTVNFNPSDGKIYVAGGADISAVAQTNLWVYDPLANTWDVTKAAMPAARVGSGSALVGQYLYVIGGTIGGVVQPTNYRYDIVNNSWTTMAPVPSASYVPAVNAIGGEIYFSGGGNLGQPGVAAPHGDASDAPDAVTTTYIYNIAANSWSNGPATGVPHSFTSAISLGSRAYIVGGFNGSVDTNVVERATGTFGGTGLLIGTDVAIGYGPNNYGYLAKNIVNYAFSNSRAVANEFAIFQDHDPWGSTVVKTAITAAGRTYATFTPAQLAGFPFNTYRVVILNWDDAFLSDFQSPYNANLAALQNYVRGGGILWVQSAIQGSAGDHFTMPFGGQANWNLVATDYVAMRTNVMVEGAGATISGNFASHANYSGLPAAARVIVKETDANGPPTFIEMALRPVLLDTNRDMMTDRTIYRPGGAAVWYSALSNGGATATAWGTTNDVDVMGDYDGDGKADIAIFRPVSGTWYILQSTTGTMRTALWGVSGDIPLSGDINADGKSELIIYRPATGTWYFNYSTGSTEAFTWGVSTDVPLVEDFNGDGYNDIAAYRPSAGAWYIAFFGGGTSVVGWGTSGDIPVVGYWDSDTIADVAIFRPSTGQWYIKNSGGGTTVVSWGVSGDTPVTGDFDGDGKTDFTIYRNGVWYSLLSGGGSVAVNWGIAGDKPQGRQPGT